MESDDKPSLDAIVEKLDGIEKYHKERSFLSRLDMMFSVLASLTLFLTSLFLASIEPVVDTHIVLSLRFPFFASLLILLIYTLIGEFYAIVKDHEILRFTYWMILFIGIFFLTIYGSYMTIFLMPIEIVFMLGYFLGLPIFVAIIFFMLFVESLYQRYIGNLCYRKPRLRTRRNYLIPTGIGLLILPVATLVTLISTIV